MKNELFPIEILPLLGIKDVIITGSQVFGYASSDSDLDIVLLVTPATRKAFIRLQENVTKTGKFGNLNIIATTNQVRFNSWVRVTKRLVQKMKDGNKLNRNYCVACFKNEFEKDGQKNSEQDYED